MTMQDVACSPACVLRAPAHYHVTYLSWWHLFTTWPRLGLPHNTPDSVVAAGGAYATRLRTAHGGVIPTAEPIQTPPQCRLGWGGPLGRAILGSNRRGSGASRGVASAASSTASPHAVWARGSSTPRVASSLGCPTVVRSAQAPTDARRFPCGLNGHSGRAHARRGLRVHPFRLKLSCPHLGA